MSLWTLNYNGTEHDLPTWNIRADISIEFISKGRCTARVSTTEAFDAATPQFSWKNPVTIYANRSAVGAGGFAYFRGYVGKIKRVAEGPNQGIAYEFYDVWWLLERQNFKQVRNNITAVDATTHARTYGTPVFLSEIYLGEQVSLSGFLVSLQTNGAEISEILSWLNECNNTTRQGNAYTGHSSSVTVANDIVNFWGRPGQDQWPPGGGLPGTAIDSGNGNAVMDPQAIIPYTRVQSISCAEAIINMLRWSPSVTVQRDFTTSPPTINFRDQLGPNTLPLSTINLSSAQERSVQARAEYERQLPGVIIEYKRTSTINGTPVIARSVDYWPLSIFDTGLSPYNGPDFTPEALSLFVELSGGTVTVTSVTPSVVAIANATSGVSATQLAFWAEYEPLLKNNPNISAITFTNSSFTVEAPGSTTAINTTAFPNVLLPKSSIPAWLVNQGTVVVTDAVMSIQATFTQKNAAGLQTHQVTRYIHARVKVTNAANTSYAGVSTGGTVDPVPTLGAGGLANQIYNGLSALTYSGRLTILETQFASGDLTGLVPGAPLKLIGPTNSYSNLFIQSVRCRPHFGELEVEYGPAARLDARDLIELWRCTRERRLYDMPSGRGSGQPGGGGGSLDQSGDTPVENNSSPPGDNTYMAEVAPH